MALPKGARVKAKTSPFTAPEEFLISSPVVAAIADLGLGNAASVANMCRRLGFEVVVSADPAGLDTADLLVLPGVGAWDSGMERLHSTGWAGAFTDAIGSGKHVLGICLGMQMLCESSSEGTTAGLGLLPGRFERISGAGRSGPRKVPHMGWNRVRFDWRDPVIEMPREGRYYFVHSFAYRRASVDVVIGTADHDGEVVAAIGRDRILGVQFHPEKSHEPGFLLMRSIGEWVISNSALGVR